MAWPSRSRTTAGYPAALGLGNDDDVIVYFTDVYAKLIAGLCERIAEVRYTDPVSQDLPIAVTPDHWQRAILPTCAIRQLTANARPRQAEAWHEH
jgi:hypothetical protein